MQAINKECRHALEINNLHLKILIPVWGEKYFRKFFAVCAKPIFSEMNLKLFNQFKSYEILFLSSTDSQPYVQEYSKQYGLEFHTLNIDDLLSCEHYGVILTIAYARAVMQSNTPQKETAFVFLNADFLISDNAFSLIAEKLNQGYSALICHTMRCVEEKITDLISQCDFKPRSLVEICLNNMHPTMAANIINQNLVYSTNNLAFHLKAPGSNLLTVSLNPHFIFIKPEVDYTVVAGYCDYDFMPTMVPSDNYYYVCDSDEMFVLEPSPAKQEDDFVQFVSDRPNKLSNWMSLALMKNKLKYTGFVHVTHASDLNIDLIEYKNKLKNYIDKLIGLLPFNFFNIYSRHDRHPFWLYPVKSQLDNGKLRLNTPEISASLIYNSMDEALQTELNRQAIIASIDESSLNTELHKVLAINEDEQIVNALRSKKRALFVTDLKLNFAPLQRLRKIYTIDYFFKMRKANDLVIDGNNQTVIFNLTEGSLSRYQLEILNFKLSGKANVAINLRLATSDPKSSLQYLLKLLSSTDSLYLNVNSSFKDDVRANLNRSMKRRLVNKCNRIFAYALRKFGIELPNKTVQSKKEYNELLLTIS